MRFGILGGDMRQLMLTNWLANQGEEVSSWGLEQVDDTYGRELETVVAADCLVLPLPISKDGSSLYAPMGTEKLLLAELWPQLRENQVICGGNISPELQGFAARYGLKVIDYFQREELQIRNAVLTAEGAIQRALVEMDRSLWRLPCLVMGWGRIGKLLAHRLCGMGAEVTVSARKAEDLVWIEAMGYHAVSTQAAMETLSDFLLVFNTVPVRLLGEGSLRCFPREGLILDLASEPGGVDMAAAERLGVRSIWARGLPGLTAPQSAAEAIGQTIYQILKERVP